MRLRIALSLTALAAGTLAVSQNAGATHVRPYAAVLVKDALVIAQQPCGAVNSTHGTPLAYPSCTLPVQVSQYLTAGTPDVNGAPVGLVGSVNLKVIPPADIAIKANITDVRCRPPTSPAVCSSANTTGPNDYTGELQILIGMRITDHSNAPGLKTPGTVIDLPFPVVVPCGSTVPTMGSTCSVNTTMNATFPGMASEKKRIVYQIPQQTAGGGVQVWDGGASGSAGAADSTLFLEPGVFLP